MKADLEEKQDILVKKERERVKSELLQEKDIIDEKHRNINK